MTRILAIFRKDARHLWPHIAVFVASLALFAAHDPTFIYQDSLGEVLYLLLPPLSCWNLIVAAIHEETLIGDRQYWLTRPFTWRDLLAAKALFILVFGNLPVFVCQSAVLAVNGFSPLAYLPVLLWKQVFFTILLLLPVAALAAVTKGLARTIVGAILILLPSSVLLLLLASHVRGFAWIRITAMAVVVLAGGSAILFFQYTRRRTVLSRSILAATVLLAVLVVSLLPISVLFAIQAWRSKRKVEEPAIRIVLEPAGKPMSADHSQVRLPVRLDAVPPGLEVECRLTSARIDGVEWPSGWMPTIALEDVSAERGWLAIYLFPAAADRIKNLPLRLHGIVYLTLSERRQTLQSAWLSGKHIPGIGICTAEGSAWAGSCLSPFPTATISQVGLYRTSAGGDADAPFPTSPWFGPLTKVQYGPRLSKGDEPHLVVMQPVAYIERSFDFPAIRLSDYMAVDH